MRVFRTEGMRLWTPKLYHIKGTCLGCLLKSQLLNLASIKKAITNNNGVASYSYLKDIVSVLNTHELFMKWLCFKVYDAKNFVFKE